MNKKQPKRRDIKTKLIAAISMLLVSSVMMVSTTYAWFTLSTAPEVRGIETAVGANGNLEMALLPLDGNLNSITTAAGDSIKAFEEKNITWGNLVDVSDRTVYGLDQITLYPSALNASDSDTDGIVDKLEDSMLFTPSYGADGRVKGLEKNTVTGTYNSAGTNFLPNDQYGVRAVGTASGMTPRQLSYRNSQSAANTAKAQAANQAAKSLNVNGSALANIAIEYGVDSANASFGQADVTSLRAIITDLKGTDGVLSRMETAYLQYILAYAASAATGTDDTVWSAVSGEVTRDGATLESVMNMVTDNGATLPTQLTTAINAYKETVEAVDEADTKLQVLEAELATDPTATFNWTEISSAMRPLANPDEMTINGIKANEVKDKLGELISSVTSQNGLKVIMGSGAGVYADIADQCGDYTASITIEEVNYNGLTLNNMTARMETKTTVSPVYLEAIADAVEAAGAPSGTGSTDQPITDMYGYIIDLAFRTNATDSKLLLRADAADRIYDGNTNEETMGAGSSMTFKATATDLKDDQLQGLMRAIRIVFFDPINNNAIIAYAKLDVDHAELGADGWTAKLYLCDAAGAATGSYEIMPLTQNTATALSVLVYLDGENIGNDDVAATASTSMTGMMNLQFASSANLVPMDYAALNIPASN